MRVFIHASDASFLRLMQRCYGHAKQVALNQIVGEGGIPFKPDDLVVVDRIPEQGFYHCKARVIVAVAVFDSEAELLAARLGAAGFISMQSPESLIVQAVSRVAAGEVWMTRETIATVFTEYVSMLNRENE